MKPIAKTQNNAMSELKNLVADLQFQLEEVQKESLLKDKVIEQKDTQINSLQHQIHLFRTAKFGRRSEKSNVDDIQGRLFDDLDDNTVSQEAESSDTEETITYTRKKRGGRKDLPKSLPYVENIQDIEESEKQCACGCELTHIGDDISEKLDVLPQVTFRVVNIKRKYACRTCEETVKVAKAKKQAFPKSIATPGLVSAIIDAKYNRHLPLYRQEEIFKDMKADINRSNLSNWIIKASKLLEPLVDLMIEKIQNYDIAYADETTLQVVNEKDKSSSSKSYMWCFIGGPPDKECSVYQYHPSRKEHIAQEFFAPFKGYLHADCYRAYVNLDGRNIKHVACFAHARRYFMDIVKSNKNKTGLANIAVKKIGELYKVERELKEKNATPDEIFNTRQNKSLPILNDFYEWLEVKSLKVPPKSPIAKAIHYAIKHWDALNRYTLDGRLDIDNNKAERTVKPFVIGRKNWLFCQNEKGANAGAILFSLVQTCKQHNVDVFAYFKLALQNIITCQTKEELISLLPFNCSTNDLEAQRSAPELIYPEKK